MMGLIVLLVVCVYVLVSIGAVTGAITYARKEGKSAKRWGWSAALVMYLIPFWDWIPTVAMHRYYCATEAGFWVHKTPEQWKKENPGVMETLVSYRGRVRKSDGDNNNFVDTSLLNVRFAYAAKHHGPLFLNRWQYEQQIVDIKTGEILVHEIDFATSQKRRQAGWSGWKLWIDKPQCDTYKHRDDGSISQMIGLVEGVKQ